MTLNVGSNLKTFGTLVASGLLLAACNSDVSVDSVEILQTYSGQPLSGRIILGSQTFAFVGKSNAAETLITSGSSAQKAIVEFDLPSNPYLPSEYARKAIIHAQFSLQFNQKTKAIEPALDESSVLMNDSESDELDCRAKISVGLKEKKLSIKLDQVGNLLACVRENSSFYDASKIGKRDVSNNTSVWKPNYYTDAQDAEMGAQFAKTFLENNKSLVVENNHPMVQYLQRRMEQLALVSDRPDLKPKVYLINANILNAFALPSGDIFFFRGLIESCRSEAELIGVAGHEWAHVAARHGTKNLSRAQLTVAGMFISSEIADIVRTQSRDEALKRITEAAKSVVLQGGQSYLLNASPEAETEADLLGSQYAMSAGFQPWGLPELFESLEKTLNTDSSTSLELASSGSQPSLARRMNQVLNFNAFFYPLRATYERTSLDFDKVRSSLSSLGTLPSKNQSTEIARGFNHALNGLVLREISVNVLDQFVKKDPPPSSP